ncbi:MAG: hypothetical protein R2788_07030 [Saprospiraceae bacterium]
MLQAAGEAAYTLQLESDAGCLSVPQSVVVDYVEMPDPPVVACFLKPALRGEILQLDATGYPGNNVTYRWYFNDGNTDELLGTTDAPTFFVNDISPNQSGIYFVGNKRQWLRATPIQFTAGDGSGHR